MNSERSNFSIIVVKNCVYVFGGIAGLGKGDEPWRPTLAASIVDRYKPTDETWSKIEISNIPSLASCSWTSTDDGRIIILGGSDGNLFTSDFFEIDFSKGTPKVTQLSTNFEFSTGMGHLVYRKAQNEIHHVGGFNSEGVNYSLQMNNKPLEWKESK
jgi:N-acetylneuraminic acid mutarotase